MKLVAAAGLPVAAGVNFLNAAPADDIPVPSDDPFEILTPAEIRYHFGEGRYVPAPCFRYFHSPPVLNGKNGLELDGGTPYLVKTVKLKGVIKQSDLLPKSAWLPNARKILIPQIRQLGFTHIHSLRLGEIPYVTSEGVYIYFPYVRGATVNL